MEEWKIGQYIVLTEQQEALYGEEFRSAGVHVVLSELLVNSDGRIEE